MSYGFDLCFTQVKNKEHAFEVAMEYVSKIKENAKEKLQRSAPYIPSMRNPDIARLTDSAKKLIDEYWLYSLFKFDFIYWEHVNILAVKSMGLMSFEKEIFPINIYFQSSCENRVEFESWLKEIPYFNKPILLFQEIIDYANSMLNSSKEIIDAIGKYIDFDDFDEEEKSDYMEKVDKYPIIFKEKFVYEKIMEMLQIESCFEESPREEVRFIKFSMSAIDSIDTHFTFSRYLAARKIEWGKECE